MTTEVNVLRQTVLSAERSFTYDDFTSGTAKELIFVKPGTRILRGWVDITTAFQGSGTITMEVGDTETDDVNRYLTSTNVKTAALTALVAPITASEIATPEAITGTLTASGTITAGAGKLHIEFVEASRSTEFMTRRS